jgi:hypothetical protein
LTQVIRLPYANPTPLRENWACCILLFTLDRRAEAAKVARITVETLYFEQPGPQNTEHTMEAARRRAGQLGVRTVLVASTTGETGAKAVEVFHGYDVVVVTHSTGFRRPNEQELLPEHRAAIVARGGRTLTCQHAFAGINRAVRRQLDTYQTKEGMKVCLEIALMAADAGQVPVGEPCIAIAGTGRGADTAVVLVPANSDDFFDLKVLEVLAKPRLG